MLQYTRHFENNPELQVDSHLVSKENLLQIFNSELFQRLQSLEYFSYHSWNQFDLESHEEELLKEESESSEEKDSWLVLRGTGLLEGERFTLELEFLHPEKETVEKFQQTLLSLWEWLVLPKKILELGEEGKYRNYDSDYLCDMLVLKERRIHPYLLLKSFGISKTRLLPMFTLFLNRYLIRQKPPLQDHQGTMVFHQYLPDLIEVNRLIAFYLKIQKTAAFLIEKEPEPFFLVEKDPSVDEKSEV